MAKNSKTVNKEYIQAFTQEMERLLLGKPKGIAEEVKRFAQFKTQNPRSTHMFIANDKIAQEHYFKMLALGSIISSAKYGLGIDYDIEEVKEIFEREKKIQKMIDELIDYAYSKGIGNKRQIEKWKKIKEEAGAEKVNQEQPAPAQPAE